MSDRITIVAAVSDETFPRHPRGGERYTLRLALRRWREPFPAPEAFVLPDLPDAAKPEAVRWIAEAATSDIEREEARFTGFQTRAGQLAGFSGLLLGLLASTVPASFVELDSPWCAMAKVVFGASLGFILVSTLLCLLSVVRPMRLRGPGRAREVRDLLEERFMAADTWRLDARRLRGTQERLVSHEWANRRKAAALFLAAASLAMGLLLTAAYLVIVLVNA